MFQTKKYNKTCSKLVINELGRCPDISFNVNFANNEQASLSVFYCCVLFCTCQTKFNQTFLIKLNYFIIDQRKLLTIFRRVQCEIQANQSNLLTFQNQASNLNKAHVMEITKACTVIFYISMLFESKKFLGFSMQRGTFQLGKRKKNRRWGKFIF